MSTLGNNYLDQCEQCKSTGLALLPVRYAVLPANVQASIPEALKCGNVQGVDLDPAHFKYGLRVIRPGFIYLFYEQGPEGKNYWEVYSVDPNGTLHLMASPAFAFALTVPYSCSRKHHHSIATEFLTIRSPDECGKIWLAFSEHKWSKETVRYYEDEANRKGRFQVFQPAEWIKGTTQQAHAAEVFGALPEVLEYKADTSRLTLPSPSDKTGKFSDDADKQYAFKSEQFEQLSTRYPLLLRNDKTHLASTYDLMASRSTDEIGNRNGTPLVFALWDAIGCTHELAGFRNEALGRVTQYRTEREKEFDALAAIHGAKKALGDQAAEKAVDKIREVHYRPKSYFEQEVAAGRWLDFPYQITELETEADPYNPNPEPTIKVEVFRDGWEERHEKARQAARDEFDEEEWPTYEANLDLKRMDTFKSQYYAVQTIAEDYARERSRQLINWLEAPLLVDTLRDYAPDNIKDGVAFEEVVAEAINGLTISDEGEAKINAWIAELKASPTNLFWRAFVLNQKKAYGDLAAALQLATGAAQEILNEENWKSTLAELNNAESLAGVYQQAASAYAAGGNNHAAQDPTRLSNMDKLGASTAPLVFRHFRVKQHGLYVKEKVIQHLFFLRAFATPEASAHVVVEQIRWQKIANVTVVRQFEGIGERAAATSASSAAGTTELRAALDAAHTSAASISGAHSGNFSLIRDARWSLLVGLIELFNLGKITAFDLEDGSAKSKFAATASMMALTAIMFDIAATREEKLAGDATAAFQKLKVAGASLAGAAAGIGVVTDFADGWSTWKKGRITLASAYATKGIVGFGYAGLVLAQAGVPAAAILSRLGVGAATVQTMEAVGNVATAILRFRVALLLPVGVWLAVGLVVAQVVIWLLEPDALETWCESCAFGNEPDLTWGTDKQMDEFRKSLGQVL